MPQKKNAKKGQTETFASLHVVFHKLLTQWEVRILDYFDLPNNAKIEIIPLVITTDEKYGTILQVAIDLTGEEDVSEETVHSFLSFYKNLLKRQKIGEIKFRFYRESQVNWTWLVK